MRFAIVTSDVPFVEGGHLIIARCLKLALEEAGHEADILTTPQNRFGRQLRAYAANAFFDVGMDGLGRPIDQVISLRFPSYAVRHPRHVCWLNHRMREYYDLWEMLRNQLRWKGKIKEKVRRRLIRSMDNILLKHNVDKVYAQSETVKERLRKWGNIPSEVLYPPPPQRAYKTSGNENFIFAVSRLHHLKRLDLLVDSFRLVQNKDLKAFIVGEGPEKESLQKKIRDNYLQDRVFILGNVDEEAIIDHFARCRAVFFAPLREDYGFVTGEAFSSRKPVITTEDSGGPAELVENGISGYILPPVPERIAEKLDALAGDPDAAERMGMNGYSFISTMTWKKAVDRLILKS